MPFEDLVRVASVMPKLNFTIETDLNDSTDCIICSYPVFKVLHVLPYKSPCPNCELSLDKSVHPICWEALLARDKLADNTRAYCQFCEKLVHPDNSC